MSSYYKNDANPVAVAPAIPSWTSDPFSLSYSSPEMQEMHKYVHHIRDPSPNLSDGNGELWSLESILNEDASLDTTLDFGIEDVERWIQQEDIHEKPDTCSKVTPKDDEKEKEKETPCPRPPGLETPPQTPCIAYKLYEGEKCYLCQRKLLPNIEDIVILRCHSSCHSKLHYECVTNSPWVLKKDEIACPTCSKPSSPLKEHKTTNFQSLFSDNHLGTPSPTDRSEDELSYLERAKMPSLRKVLAKIRELLGKYCPQREYSRTGTMASKFLFERTILKFIRKTLGVSEENDQEFGVVENNQVIKRGLDALFPDRHFTKRYIIKEKGSWMTNAKNVAQDFVLAVSIRKLLQYGINLKCISMYFTDSVSGLLRLGFGLEDLVRIQNLRRGTLFNMDVLVNAFHFSFSAVRSVHKTFFSIDVMIDRKASFAERSKMRCRLTADTMREIGLFTHELCVLGMKKEDIHRFGFSQVDWYEKLNFREIHIKLLRIKMESDFAPPGGSLYKAYWDTHVMIEHLQLAGILHIPSSSSSLSSPRVIPILSPTPVHHYTIPEVRIEGEQLRRYPETPKKPKGVTPWRRQNRTKPSRYSKAPTNGK